MKIFFLLNKPTELKPLSSQLKINKTICTAHVESTKAIYVLNSRWHTQNGNQNESLIDNQKTKNQQKYRKSIIKHN